MKRFEITVAEEIYVNGGKVNESYHTIESNGIEPFNEKVTEFEKIVDNADINSVTNGYTLTTNGNSCVLSYNNRPTMLTILRGVSYEENIL